MRLKPLLFLCVATAILFISFDSTAQTADANYFIPTPLPRSPSAAEFAKYGDYKVNLFTGLPDISIPLFTIQSGGLEVPITLSYHASGIKVAQLATWVGLGWSVSPGGVVSRNIMGKADDDPNGGGLLSGTFRSSINVNADSDIYYMDDVLKGIKDTRPDIYSYSFPGHDGKFFFDPTNGLKPAMIPFAPVAVTKASYGFNIKDEHGNSYTFNQTENTTTTSAGHTTGATTAWSIGNMISQNKRDTITFTYNKQVMWYPEQSNNMDILSQNVTTVTGTVASPYTSQYTARNNSFTDVGVGENDPSVIYYKNGKVVFELDASSRTDVLTAPPKGLNDIQVYGYNYSTKSYQLLKKIVFFKSYFTNSTQSRLRLDSIQIQDAAGAIIQHYRFDYNTGITMPGYDSPGIDFWGYYNGKDISDNRVKNATFLYQPNSPGGLTSITIGSSTTTNNRDPDSTKMQADVLTTIHYPTGGYTTFTYQTNRYPDGGSISLAGGLRVATIQSYDGSNPTPIIKTYKYNSAQPNFDLDHSYFGYQETHNNWGIGTNIINQTETVGYYVSNPRFDLDPYDAAPVVYPSVSEYIGTPGTNIGRTDYLFRWAGDQAQSATQAGIPVIQSNFYQRGQLLRKKEYRFNSNGTYQVVKKDSSTYTAFPINPHSYAGLLIGKHIVNDGQPGPFVTSMGGIFSSNPNFYNGYAVGYYDIPSDDNYLTSMTTYLYDAGDTTKYTTSTVTYKYDNIKHLQVSRTYHTDSKGNINVTVSKFPADYLSGSTTYNPVLDSMLNHNMQAEVVEKWDSLKNVTTSVNAVTGGQLNQYAYGYSGAFVAGKISTLRAGVPLIGFVPSSIISGSLSPDIHYVQMISFDNYDGQNNIAQYTARNATPVSILWDYQNSLPIAQVKNALNTSSVNKNIAYTSFEADGKGNWSFIGAPSADFTAPEGLNSYSLANGTVSVANLDNTKSYVVSYWSNNGAATVNSSTGSPLRSSGGWTYYEHIIPSGTTTVVVSGTTTIDALRLYPANAQMTTYTYDPNGLTEIGDVKGQISSFEYDAFQRLKNIKDINGNVVNNYGYHTYDMTVPNDAQSGTFTRNNCPAGTSPTSTTYAVAAGKYLSSTKASANAEAIYDRNVNGQIKANIVCGCPIQMISVTLTNTTGLAGFQAHFTGPNTYNFNFPTSGSTIVQVAYGTTYTLQIPAVSPFNNHTYTLGTRTPVVAPSATWTSVNIATGSSDLTVKVQ